MTQNKSNLETVVEAMELTGAETIGELVSRFHEHGVANATELIEKLRGDRRG